VSVADDKLNATAGRVGGSGLGLLSSLRTQHPTLATVLIRGAEVAAWVAFYVVVRALTG
jgi:hypothetical protein